MKLENNYEQGDIVWYGEPDEIKGKRDELQLTRVTMKLTENLIGIKADPGGANLDELTHLMPSWNVIYLFSGYERKVIIY